MQNGLNHKSNKYPENWRPGRNGQINGQFAAHTGDGRDREADDSIHKRFDALIPDFFEDRLGVPQLSRFLNHYETCPECRDELSIQYLIHEGLAKLETGESFNLEKDLNQYIEKERGRLSRRRMIGRMTFLYELLTLLVFAAAVVAYLVLYVL